MNNIELLTTKNLAEVWNDIEDKYINILTITVKNNKKITPQEQFEAIYENQYLITRDQKTANNIFLITFYDNLFILKQIEQVQQSIEELSNFDNWALKDVYESVGDNKATGVTKIKGETYIKDSGSNQDRQQTNNTNTTNLLNNTRAGASDNNSYLGDALQGDIMDVSSSISIPANSMSQNQTKQDTTTKNTNTDRKDYIFEQENKGNTNNTTELNTDNVNTLKSTKTSSDTSKDHREYLATKIPQLRRQFLLKFEGMFVL